MNTDKVKITLPNVDIELTVSLKQDPNRTPQNMLDALAMIQAIFMGAKVEVIGEPLQAALASKEEILGDWKKEDEIGSYRLKKGPKKGETIQTIDPASLQKMIKEKLLDKLDKEMIEKYNALMEGRKPKKTEQLPVPFKEDDCPY